MNTEIRRALLEEIPIIRDIAKVAFRYTYGLILSSDQIDYMMDWMYSEDSLMAQMVGRSNVFYIMSVNGKDVGYASFERHINPPSDLDGKIVFNLQKLYILPQYQGYSCGTILLKYVEDQMLSLVGSSPAVYELNVNRNNSAVIFYQKQGLEINREGDFPIGNGYYMNDYIMRKSLSIEKAAEMC